jgi:outer membrane immunogenic protein
LKKSFLAGASLGAVALTTGAQAADLGLPLPTKAPPLPAPFSWTGFYVGGQVGGVWARDSSSNNFFAVPTGPLVNTTNLNASSVIGGVEAGLNLQIDHFVFGVEGDVSWASLNTTVGAAPFPALNTYTSRLNDLGTIRGRIGWAFDRFLVFGSGGAAFANLPDQFSIGGGFGATPTPDVTGWAAGGGIEYAFLDHWTVKAEYLHVGFQDRSATLGIVPAYAVAFKDSFDIARVGINYKF